MLYAALEQIPKYLRWEQKEQGIEMGLYGEFPGGPVVRTWCFHSREPGFNLLIGELRSYKPHGCGKRKKKKKKERKKWGCMV